MGEKHALEKSICFISCVNNEEVYSKALAHIKALSIPEGYTIEVIGIRQADSIFAGYNAAMKMSNSKYKVYLHQDVFILNKNFIIDVIGLFKKHEKLGMLGVVGTARLHENGIWWHGGALYGKVYDSAQGVMKLRRYRREIKEDYQSVKAIDGLIMVTQYDIDWREDLFNGWHFYDASQCLEFIKRGYEVGVPKQKECWCEHDCGIVSKAGYTIAMRIFLKEYKEIMSKIMDEDRELDEKVY